MEFRTRRGLSSGQLSWLRLTWTAVLLSVVVGTTKSQADLNYNIDEEQSPGTYIGSITENQVLYRNLTSSQRKQLRYGLLDQSRYPASLFRVNEATGGIFVAGRIDREDEQCYRQPLCLLEFNVALSSARIPFSNIARVGVTVRDLNDNPPYFPAQPSGRAVLEMSEQATVGTGLKLTGAADRDWTANNTVRRYALSAFRSVFSVSATTGLDGGSVLDLRLLQSLDREAVDSYRLAIIAYDGGSPPLSAALNVQIAVTDENDNAPVFRNDSYFATVRDEVSPSQVVVKVSASDLDIGDYGRVKYQLSSLQREQLEQQFHVDEATGEIRVVSDLPPGVHRFVVEAVDGGKPPLKSQTVVSVRVVSSKNNPPSLQINTLSNGSNSVVEISEDAGAGSFVAFVTAEDPDEGLRGQVTCRLDGSVLRLEALAGKGYTLTLRGPLDREQRESYNVTVTCSDSGSPPLSSVRSLAVVVSDVNDNPPVFSWNTFSHSVPEGNYTDRHILQVSASDPDRGRNAELSFSLDPSATPPFAIHPDTGIVSARGHLDREATPAYSFNVYVADKGPGAHTATALVLITLEDVNDQYPTFNRPIFEFRVPEDAPEQTLLGKLVAYDKDDGLNAQFEFFYAGSMDGADPFVVDSSGTVRTSGPLDRERRESYSFTVMVRDKGLPPKTTYASVVVTVLDVNDNAPRIQFPEVGNHTIQVTAVPEPDMVLAKIVAYDSDAAENGSLHFLLLSGHEDGALGIDPSSGQIRVKDVSKVTDGRSYRLVVGVEDHGRPRQRSNTTILVSIRLDQRNAGFAPEEGEKGEEGVNYVIIVAGVTGATFVLSAIIIVAICFIFRQDRQYRSKYPPRNNQAGIHDDGEFFSRLPAPGNLCDDEKLRPCQEEEGDKGPDDVIGYDDSLNVFNKELAMETFRSSQRKKEVSFADSGAPATEADGPIAVAGSPMSHPYRPAPGGYGVMGPSEKDYMKHPHPLVNRHLDEVGSDTSGDTGTSDSGRGGSEDDVNLENMLHGGDRHGPAPPSVPSVQPGVDNERYSRFPPPRAPKGEHHKQFHVRFDTSVASPSRDLYAANQRPGPRSVTPSHDPHSPNQQQQQQPPPQRSVSFSPSVRGSPGPSMFSPRSTTREGNFATSTFKDVTFTPVPQHSPQRTLSTFSSPGSQPPASFTTFRKPPGGAPSAPKHPGAGGGSTSVEDDASTTTSGSYTVNPEELRMDTYIGSDVIV